MIAKVVVKAFVALMDDWGTHCRHGKAPHETDKVSAQEESFPSSLSLRPSLVKEPDQDANLKNPKPPPLTKTNHLKFLLSFPNFKSLKSWFQSAKL